MTGWLDALVWWLPLPMVAAGGVGWLLARRSPLCGWAAAAVLLLALIAYPLWTGPRVALGLELPLLLGFACGCRWTVAVGVVLPLLVAYTTALAWCVDRWLAPTAYFEHGWLVLPLLLGLLAQRAPQLAALPGGPDRRGLWLLVPGLLLHLYGALLMVDSASAVSLLWTVPGAVWATQGAARLRAAWPLLGLLLFFVPAPIYVEGRLAFTLKEFAVAAGAAVANLLGAAVERRGSTLLLVGTRDSLYVADACGGLRSLLAMAMLAYGVAFFTGAASWRRRLPMLVAALPVAVFANVVRIAVLCLFARWFGVPFAEGSGHSLANAAEWLADLAALWGLDRLCRPRLRYAPAPAAVPWPAAASTAPPRWLWLGLWLLAIPLLLLSLYRPAAGPADRAQRLPREIPGFVERVRSPAEAARLAKDRPRWQELLGTPDFEVRRYQDPAGRLVSLVVLFHDTNWKSVHPPRICIEGSGHDLEVDDVVAAPWLGAGGEVGRLVSRSRADGWRYVTLVLFGTRDWAAGSYEQFTWHHMPRALVRAGESGFLLRAEAPIYRGETAADAEARAAAFLKALLPLVREQLQ